MSILTNEQLERISNLRLLKEQGNITETEMAELKFLENVGNSKKPSNLNKIFTLDDEPTGKLSDKEIKAKKEELAKEYNANLDTYKEYGFEAFLEAVTALEIKKHTCGLINNEFALNALKEFGTKFNLKSVVRQLINEAIDSPQCIIDIMKDSTENYPKTQAGLAVKSTYFQAIAGLTDKIGSENIGIDYVTSKYAIDHACVAYIPRLLKRIREAITTYKPELKETLPSEPTKHEVRLLGGILTEVDATHFSVINGKTEHIVAVIQEDLLDLYIKIVEDKTKTLLRDTIDRLFE